VKSEVEHRIKAALSAFGRLTHRVFLNHNLAISTKVSVYKAVCVSVLLYGCEAWTLYRKGAISVAEQYRTARFPIMGRAAHFNIGADCLAFWLFL